MSKDEEGEKIEGMYFLPRSNKFLAWAVTINVRYLYALSCAVMVTVVSLWFLLMYKPLIYSIEQLQRQHTQQQTQIVSLASEKKSYEQLVTSVDHKQTQLAQYQGREDAASASQATVLWLMQQAHRTSLTVTGVSLGHQEERGWYNAQQVHLELQGAYGAILSFLTECAQSHHLNNIVSVVMSRLGDTLTVKMDIEAITVL